MLVIYGEDDLDDYQIFTDIITEINPKVRCMLAQNGIEVLELLESSILLPDYIFLDINMPLMNGIDCLKKIKDDNRFNDVPVIMYTTGRNPKDIDTCKHLGAYKYIYKHNTYKEAIGDLAQFFQ